MTRTTPTARFLCSLLLCACAASLASPAMGAAPAVPVVAKVEPPNWWAGLPSPMLLLTGENLAGARVTTSYPGVKVRKVEARPDGRYAFVWLEVRPAAAPGNVPLKLQTAGGATSFQFPLQARAPREGRFQGLSPDDVIYLIMPDRFADGDPGNNRPPHSSGVYDRQQAKAYHGGDLRGVRQRLPYLRDLGVTALWLTPVWKNTDSDYHGYHVVDFYATDEHMGSLRDYQELVAEAHRLGIKVLIDYVVNHTGPEHPWAVVPPTPTWIHGTADRHLDAVYRFNGLVDPHAPPRLYRGTLEGWFANKLPDLNPDDPLLEEYLKLNAIWWTELTGLDGYRLDTFPYSSRRFWAEWHGGIFRAYPRTATIGEVWDGDTTITSFFAGGRKQRDGVDTRATTVFDFPLSFALRDVLLRGQSVHKIVDVLQRDGLYSRPDLLVTFLGNHDTRRFMGEEGATSARLKAAFSLLLTMRGIPQVYSGDEIGMRGGDDPDNRRDFPGGFPGDARDAFTASGRTAEEQEVFAHLQALLRLRRQHPALRQGRHWHISWDDASYVFLRETAEERLLVVFNNSGQAREIAVPVGDTPLQDVAALERLFGAGEARIQDGSVVAHEPAGSVSVYRVTRP